MIKSKIGIILTGTALALITQGCSSGSQPVAASSSATDSSATSIAAPNNYLNDNCCRRIGNILGGSNWTTRLHNPSPR